MKVTLPPLEMTNAHKTPKYNKRPGMDNILVEQVQNGPIEGLSNKISEILNETGKTGLYPKEIKLRQLYIMIPLQKPGEKAGPPENLRPIILLSPLHKILAIIMIKHISEKTLK